MLKTIIYWTMKLVPKDWKHRDKVAHNVLMSLLATILLLLNVYWVTTLLIVMLLGILKEIYDYLTYGKDMDLDDFLEMSIGDLIADIPYVGYLLYRLVHRYIPII